ncbi:MAG: ABC transporter ATP-binding protein [candidate division Zixibacteria bacterium]|nr:ABC transporter ATP-binding protein [candidate division Zixibacteria bacterium]
MATSKGGLFVHLIPIIKKHSGYIWVGAVATLFANSLALIVPYLIKLSIEVIEKGEPVSIIFTYCLYMIGLTIVAGLFRFTMRRTIIWASRKAEYDIRGLMFTKWLELDSSYYDLTKTGKLMAHATNDIEAVRMMTGPGIMHILNTIISTVVAIGFMSSLSVQLTIATVLPLLMLALSYNVLGQLVHKKFTKIQEHFAYMTSQVQENIAGIRVIKAYGREESEINRFEKISQEYADMNLDMMKIYGFFRPLLFAISGGVSLLVLYVGGKQVAAGTISLGTLVAFFGYLGWLVWPMMALGWVISLYQRGTASLKRINTILNTETKIVNSGEKAAPQRDITGSIEFRNLNFTYPASKDEQPPEILKSISLTIEAGSRVGITGPTGSGKTTLVSLIPRLYPAKPGELFIEGIDSTLWPLEKLRAAIGYVSQETFLFSDTLEANINFSSDEVSPEKIIESARLAALHEDVEGFPEKYDTILGERGITLSGGQKQRAALARAILKSPSIIILDDATSSVDTETEQDIFKNLNEVLPGRTSIIISHRISSLKDCDKIIYLDNGVIAEEGSHEALIAQGGMYALLYKRQMMEDKLENM